MRRQAGVAALVAASLAFALLAVGTHEHDLPNIHTHDLAIDSCADESAISVACTVCTLVHVSATGAVACIGSYVPGLEQSLRPHDSVTLPDGPALCSQGSRAPPAPHVGA